MSSNMSLVRLLEETPDDVAIIGDLMEMEEEKKSFSQDFDTFYDAQESMLYLGDGERVIGVRKRNAAGNDVIVTRDIAPVDDYAEIKENEGFPAVVGYAEETDFAGYDSSRDGFYTPEEQISKSGVPNRSNSADKTVSRALNQ